jgi:hypothetical protein
MFRRNVFPPSAGHEMEAAGSSETLVPNFQIKQRYTSEHRNLKNKNNSLLFTSKLNSILS